MKPLKGRIIIEKVEDEERTESGLYLAHDKIKQWRGLVIACGGDWVKDGKLYRSPCSSGDMIYLKGKSHKVYKDLVLVWFDQVIGVVPKEEL